jgi:hypothetical protein
MIGKDAFYEIPIEFLEMNLLPDIQPSNQSGFRTGVTCFYEIQYNIAL